MVLGDHEGGGGAGGMRESPVEGGGITERVPKPLLESLEGVVEEDVVGDDGEEQDVLFVCVCARACVCLCMCMQNNVSPIPRSSFTRGGGEEGRGNKATQNLVNYGGRKRQWFMGLSLWWLGSRTNSPEGYHS